MLNLSIKYVKYYLMFYTRILQKYIQSTVDLQLKQKKRSLIVKPVPLLFYNSLRVLHAVGKTTQLYTLDFSRGLFIPIRSFVCVREDRGSTTVRREHRLLLFHDRAIEVPEITFQYAYR